MKSLLIAVGAAALSGCAGFSESDCKKTDWLVQGNEDALEGRISSESLKEYRETCAAAGISPDAKQYNMGYQEGLKLFCTQDNGFEVGKDGYEYGGICPRTLEQEFVKGYTPGYELSKISADMKSQQETINSIKRAIAEINVEIRRIEAFMFSDAPPIEKASYEPRLSRFVRRKNELEAQQFDVQKELNKNKKEFRRLEEKYEESLN